ncbi:unnamed protein product [Eruca vesicaria subsp. sativa]|uniref:Protein WVD2-like 7 n=1 Tax=Eruca vesicaria subsp. sativa TaxID=29727 RepID=A0ABC8L320_ERUVS|nr:unnamed protein product [Eruca vesicaria subsp. sativa]
MGDMEVAIASGEDKIMTTNQEMQVSISFGKFEKDSLSWEKFSTFSPNKYLEEVEKCATPGSVAQKKAYFESHYKKIAERNAEIILEQEKQLERNASFRPSLENGVNTDNREHDRSVVVESNACYGSNGESSSEDEKIVNRIATEVNDTCNHEPPLEETMKVEIGEDLNTLKMGKLEEIVCVEEVEDNENPEDVVCIEELVKEDVSSKDTPLKEPKKEKDQHLTKNVPKNHTRSSPKPNQVAKKPVASKVVTSKKTQTSKEKSMIKATTNKAASPVSKGASKFSTPRVSKPASATSSMSASSSSVKKENVSTLQRKKQTAPKTLQHTSLNLDQPSSDPTPLSTTRRSLIMERMGDKEIVRRAFKTFQKSFDQMKEQDTAPKQVPAKATSVSKLATTGLKENGRLAKSDGTDKKGYNSHRSSSFVTKSNKTAEKQEISRPGARAVERISLPAKPKAEVTNAKTRRQSLDPKAKSMRGPLPKGSSDKVL